MAERGHDRVPKPGTLAALHHDREEKSDQHRAGQRNFHCDEQQHRLTRSDHTGEQQGGIDDENSRRDHLGYAFEPSNRCEQHQISPRFENRVTNSR